MSQLVVLLPDMFSDCLVIDNLCLVWIYSNVWAAAEASITGQWSSSYLQCKMQLMKGCVCIVGYFKLESPLLQHRLQQHRKTQETVTSAHSHVNEDLSLTSMSRCLLFPLGFVYFSDSLNHIYSYCSSPKSCRVWNLLSVVLTKPPNTHLPVTRSAAATRRRGTGEIFIVSDVFAL